MNEKLSKLESLEGFSEETLSEMAIDAVEGGVDDNNGLCPENLWCPNIWNFY